VQTAGDGERRWNDVTVTSDDWCVPPTTTTTTTSEYARLGTTGRNSHQQLVDDDRSWSHVHAALDSVTEFQSATSKHGASTALPPPPPPQDSLQVLRRQTRWTAQQQRTFRYNCAVLKWLRYL